MFLIEFCDGGFIDGEQIDYLKIESCSVRFSLKSDTSGTFVVQSGMEKGFLNQLQSINDNTINIQSYYLKLKEEIK